MKAIFDNVEEVAQNIKSFWFRPEKNLRYIAGQYVELCIPHDDKDNRGDKRWFSLSSSPTEELVAVTTKFTEGSSSFKRKLLSLKPGDAVDMHSPMGDFVLPKDTSLPVLFVACGIGCTPYRSMLKFVIDTGEQRPIGVIYAAATLNEVAFRPLFESAGDGLDILLDNPPPEWHGLRGPLNGQMILARISDPDKQLVYLSGPEQTVEKLERDLINCGFSKKQIRTDFFHGYAGI